VLSPLPFGKATVCEVLGQGHFRPGSTVAAVCLLGCALLRFADCRRSQMPAAFSPPIEAVGKRALVEGHYSKAVTLCPRRGTEPTHILERDIS
jgi:hypothetical protein